MNNPRIDKLLARKAEIDAQLKAARARDRVQKRKDDTRCKIIAGALILEHASRNPDSEFAKTVARLIHEGVTTKRDRELFGLDPLPSEPGPGLREDFRTG